MYWQLSSALRAFGGASLAYILYFGLAVFVKARQRAALAKKWNTQECPIQKNRYPFGLDNIARALRADRDKVFPTDAIQRTKDVGSITYTYSNFVTGTFTADEKNIQALLATQFHDFDLGSNRRDTFFPLFGDGIFTQDGPAWEHSRAMMRPQFVREQVHDLDLEERHVQNMMHHLTVSTGGWTNEVDLQVLFFRLTLDTATEFLFGKSTDGQLAALPSLISVSSETNFDEQKFASAFDTGQMVLATRFRLDTIRWLYNPPEFRQACKDCHSFADYYVELALSKKLREKVMGEGSTDGKTRYIFLEALAEHTQDPFELRSQCLNLLVAGRDTTASLLGWLFVSLARDPARYTKLRNAIIRNFGTYDSPMPITFTKLKTCIYLQYCINEALRLYPPVAMNFRKAKKDTTLPRGGGLDGKSKIFIPKGMLVNYSVHVLHRRQDIWGPDADDFIPERWEGRKVGWEFLPFNGGPRICIGQQFALAEASYVTVRLLQRFSMIENRDFEPIRHNYTLINSSANGVKVRLRE